MHVPKQVLFGVALIAAAFLGWMVHASIGEASATRLSAPAASGPTVSPGQPVHVTIVMNDSVSNPARQQSPEFARAQSAAPERKFVAPTSTGERRESEAAPAWTPTNLSGPRQVQGLSIIANGDHIVIAEDGSIVSVGDNTVVRGNTGDAGASGSIAMDVDHSVLTSGDSGLSASIPATQRPGTWTTYPEASGALPQLTNLWPQTGTQSGELHAFDAPQPGLLLPGPAEGSTGRAVGIAGYEIHSIDIGGSHNLVTYDDSNLFFDRNGTLNGNTGDTDTSGLNVVDAARSVVRSGDSGNSDETPDPPPFNPASLGSPSLSGLLSTPTTGGSSVSVADVNGISTATGEDSLVIGGDGMDDNGVRVQGDHNVATYDDGNVAIGGTGNVNAQIGDSDTSGTVAMAIRDSNIVAGNSFLPAWQQAGAQVGDPFDGNDPDVGPPDAPTPRLSAPVVQPSTTASVPVP